MKHNKQCLGNKISALFAWRRGRGRSSFHTNHKRQCPPVIFVRRHLRGGGGERAIPNEKGIKRKKPQLAVRFRFLRGRFVPVSVRPFIRFCFWCWKLLFGALVSDIIFYRHSSEGGCYRKQTITARVNNRFGFRLTDFYLLFRVSMCHVGGNGEMTGANKYLLPSRVWNKGEFDPLQKIKRLSRGYYDNPTNNELMSIVSVDRHMKEDSLHEMYELSSGESEN